MISDTTRQSTVHEPEAPADALPGPQAGKPADYPLCSLDEGCIIRKDLVGVLEPGGYSGETRGEAQTAPQARNEITHPVPRPRDDLEQGEQPE